MNTLETLNFLGSLSFEVIKYPELEVNKKIPIQQFKAVDTVYGRRILVVFVDRRAVWLPERFQDLSTDFLQKLNTEKFDFIYKGRTKIPTGREINDIEFAKHV